MVLPPVSHRRRTLRRLVAQPPGRLDVLLRAIPATGALVIEPALGSPATPRAQHPPSAALIRFSMVRLPLPAPHTDPHPRQAQGAVMLGRGGSATAGPHCPRASRTTPVTRGWATSQVNLPRSRPPAGRVDDVGGIRALGGAGPESWPLDPAAGSWRAQSRPPGRSGIMGGMPLADSRRRASPTSPPGSGTAAHAAPWQQTTTAAAAGLWTRTPPARRAPRPTKNPTRPLGVGG